MTNNYEEYKQKLNAAINGGKPAAVSNKTRSHNAQITCEILKQGGRVRMYCGKMSVFRKKFYEKIKEQEGINLASRVELDVIEGLSQFLNDPKNKLEIVLARYHRLSDIDDLINSDLFEEGLDKRRIVIRVADRRKLMVDALSHITLSESGNMARVEYIQKNKVKKPSDAASLSGKDHSAIFYSCMNPQTMEKYSKRLNVITEGSFEIEA